MATLTDISRQTNLALGTVSEILRGRPGYNEATRQRVLTAAKELNYRPNRLARGLRNKRSGSIGLVIEALATHHVTMSKAGMAAMQIKSAGYTCLVGSHHGDPAIERQVISELRGCQVDGIVLMAPCYQNSTYLAELATQMPIVLLESLPDAQNCQVTLDREKATAMQLEHMLAHVGCKRIVFFIHSPIGLSIIKRRGYESTLARHGQSFDDHLVVPLPTFASQHEDPAWRGSRPLERHPMSLTSHRQHLYETVRSYILELLRRGETFDGVVAANDELATIAMLTLQAQGVRIPEDVAVIGFDNDPMSAYLPTPLSTIHQPREVGAMAVDMLLNRINQPDDTFAPTACHLFEPELVVRQSTLRLSTPSAAASSRSTTV